MTDLITIANDHLTAQINPHGAELTHLHDADSRELMTNADPAFWTGHAPILFPVVGVVNEGVIRLDGQAYPMQKHGFARHSTFDVVAQSETSATFRLTDSDETRKAYPFAFALDLVFTLDGATLTLKAHIHNRTDAAMPASFGFHPAFAWPLPYGEPRADYRITFDADEPGKLKAISPDGQIAVDERPLSGRGPRHRPARRAVRQGRAGLGPDPLRRRHLWRQDRPAVEDRLPRHPQARHLDQARRGLCLRRTLARHRGPRRLYRRLSRQTRRVGDPPRAIRRASP
ncbi:aldose epimerase family protein [Sphingomonas sp. H160509]|uniref:aldose epimerase family protein n=1 Tax=Sphingomonas sp. H160509 TaxID=2955313 RepID=UPI00406C6D58